MKRKKLILPSKCRPNYLLQRLVKVIQTRPKCSLTSSRKTTCFTRIQMHRALLIVITKITNSNSNLCKTRCSLSVRWMKLTVIWWPVKTGTNVHWRNGLSKTKTLDRYRKANKARSRRGSGILQVWSTYKVSTQSTMTCPALMMRSKS